MGLRLCAQYVKLETIEYPEEGRIARATRVITENASRRIGETAFEIASQRPRKVCKLDIAKYFSCLPCRHNHNSSCTLSTSPTFYRLLTGFSVRLFAVSPHQGSTQMWRSQNNLWTVRYIGEACGKMVWRMTRTNLVHPALVYSVNLSKFLRKRMAVMCRVLIQTMSIQGVWCNGRTKPLRRYPLVRPSILSWKTILTNVVDNRDAAAALVGSLGLIPSINKGDKFVMGEP